MSVKIGLVCLLILVAATATKLQTNSIESQYVPIPKRFPGILIGDGNAPITIELVYDPTCIFLFDLGDGSADFDKTIQDFTKGLDQDTLSKVSFRYDLNVLPYHISSFKLATAVRYVQAQLGNQEALRVLRYFLENIESWDEKSIEKITINAHLNNIATKVSSLTGLNKDDVRKEIAHYSATDGQTRQWAKYVMGSLRIPGTP